MTRKYGLLTIILIFTFFNLHAVSDSLGTKLQIQPAEFFSNAMLGNSTAMVMATDKGTTINFTNPYNGQAFGNSYAGTFSAKINGADNIKLYCIDIMHHLAFWKANQPHTYIDAGNTPSQITYILNNYYPYKAFPYSGSMSTDKKEAAAVQLAVWHYADGIDVNTITPADIKSRVIQIVADADANAGNTTPVATLVINPASQVINTNQGATMRVYAYNEIGQPVSGVNVSLTTNGGLLNISNGVTNSFGYLEFTVQDGGSNYATITATAEVKVPQGTRYVHSVKPDEYQKLVLATPALATRQFTASVEWENNSDLKITKTVDNANPIDGETINFTVTVTNDGPSEATNIWIMDIIDQGFNIQSTTVTQGTFYDGTESKGSKTIMPPGGTWDVGSLANGASATLQISVKVSSTELLSTRLDLGDASDFNVFVFQDINQPSSDTEGKMAAGRDIFLANYSVGDKLPNSNGTEDVLVAGRNLTFLTGAVFAGNVVYGDQTNLPVDYVSVEGEVRKDTIFNFSAAKSYLVDLSSTIADYQINGTDSLIFSSLHLNGSHPIVNIFKVEEEAFNNSLEIFINVPIGSTALVNIEGDSLKFDGGLVLSGTDKYTTLFNFYQATKLEIVAIDVQGTVLAPKADVNYISGQLNGQFIANSIKGQGQFNIAKFIGNVPATSTLQNIAELIWVDQIDPDSEPGNGVDTEDDYSAVTINVTPNLSVGSGTVNANWQYSGSSGSDEIIWTFNRDVNGNLLSGTWGGKIYRSIDEGASWEHVNPTMNVGYIWSLLPFDNGEIFAATERGIYSSNNLGLDWAIYSLTDKDVRSIVASSGKLYAAVWGEGVYVSSDNGANWATLNNGLIFLAVNSLAIDNNNNLYAGTFGGGLFKLENGSETWNTVSAGYDHIWSVAVNSNNEVFLGTYGNGLFYSSDGSTFSKQSDVTSPYIYSISVDGANVFASAWNGGIYYHVGTTKGSWQQLGLVGFDISSVYFNGSKLYAGTSNGKVYVNDKPTSVSDNNNNIVTTYSLEQNYPNPFNPTTIIKFSVAEQTNVKLSIFDVLGKKVATLVDTEMQAGAYSLVWNATDNFGKKVASGIYFYSIETGKFTKTMKMLLLK